MLAEQGYFMQALYFIILLLASAFQFLPLFFSKRV